MNLIRKKARGALSRFRYPLSVGRVRFGSFRRLNPISRKFGYDRGTPIDRYYIKTVLNRNRYDIRGARVGNPRFRFHTKIWRFSCELDIDAKNPKVTLIADLAAAADVPSDLFDCIICTQTLQMIYDVRAAVSHLHRMLKPGGVLLVTTHGTSRLDSGQSYHEYWRFTAASASRLFEEFFPRENVQVESHGNVFALLTFLEGLALEEVSTKDLDYHDPPYELLITIRAMKPRAGFVD